MSETEKPKEIENLKETEKSKVIERPIPEERKNNYMDYKRPRVLHGYTSIIQSGCGKLHITVNFDGVRPVEVYVRSSASGGCEANANCIGRLISRMLQLGAPVNEVLEQLHSTRCPTAMRATGTKFIFEEISDQPIFIKSCPDGIGRAIEAAMKMRGICDTESTIKQIKPPEQPASK